MKLNELSEAQYRRYFESRLAENRFRKSQIGYMALCPFHDDKNPSLSISTEKGVWRCHACNFGGGLLDFEMRYSSCDKETALTRIADIMGEVSLNLGQRPEAIYSYTDVFGRELFQVVRYPGKRFTQRRPDGKGGWIYETKNLKMVLYKLPQVATAQNIILTEGEKDADNLEDALRNAHCLSGNGPQSDNYSLDGKNHIAVTTCPRGAGKWKDEYSVFFAGKQVLILPDNDEAGEKHANQVASSVHRYAAGVKILRLPDLPLKGDVSDYLKKSTATELLELAQKTPWWRPPESETSLFMTSSQFMGLCPDSIEWLVEGIIQRKSNGMLISRPKSGKSFTILDLALALASGQKWLDFYIPKRVKTAVVSREDNAGLTQWRYKQLAQHRNLTPKDLDGWLHINAKGLKPKVMLDYPEDVEQLIRDLKHYETEFLILDVMRVLHSAEENDNTEMQKIIDVLNHIQSETGASICLIHHDNKREDATLTERARGASAIAGWAEFICGIKIVDDTDWTREFVCELKASMAPDKFYYRIVDSIDGGIELTRVQWTPPQKGKRVNVTEAPF